VVTISGNIVDVEARIIHRMRRVFLLVIAIALGVVYSVMMNP
jgi:hypothetical protein